MLYTIYTFRKRVLYMISLLSYNIALAKPSYCAPPDWSDEYGVQQNNALKKCMLIAQPTFIALQEIPYPKWPLNILSIDQYIPLGSASSHCGYTSLIINRKMVHLVQSVFQVGPCIVAILKKDDDTLAVASCHLAPFKKNAALISTAILDWKGNLPITKRRWLELRRNN